MDNYVDRSCAREKFRNPIEYHYGFDFVHKIVHYEAIATNKVSVVSSDEGSGAVISVPVTVMYIYLGLLTSGELGAVSYLLYDVKVSTVGIYTMDQAIESLATIITSYNAVNVEGSATDDETMVNVSVDVLYSAEEVDNDVDTVG